MERYDLPMSVPFVHRVCFTRDAFAVDNSLLRDLLSEGGGRRVLVFLEAAVADAWPLLTAQIQSYFSVGNVTHSGIVVGFGGEPAKADDHLVRSVWDKIEKEKIDRHSYVLCIGGGAFLDAVGFGVATAHRGIRFLRFPTTTLSQDDSGVGVKNGINSFGKKNWVGTFSVPYAVVNDFLFLRSQNPEINRQGLIEAIKVALVKDVAFFDWIEEHAAALSLLQDDVLQECVKRSALLHARHITSGGDPFEMGSSRPLDFGHWAAHKLEQLTQFQLSHAAAVAIGLWLDVKYSVKCGLLLQSHAERIGRVLQRMEMPMFHEMLSVRDADGALLVIKGLEEFREHLGGRLTVLLLKEPGVGVDAYEMDASLIETCVLEMQQAAMQMR